MRINQLFESDDPVISEYKLFLRKLANECSLFLRESQRRPIFKILPSSYNDLQKVKVRKQRGDKTKFSQTFNEAFGDEIRDLRQRAIFTNSQIVETTVDTDLFFVFPTDGYKFMYSKEVTHSSNDYQQVFDSLFEQFEDEKAEQMIHDLLKFTYVRENLFEGIEKQSEIIFYNVPYYYSARATTFQYDNLLTDMAEVSDNIN